MPKPQPRSRKKSASEALESPSTGTRDRILDAAERLFGERNYDTVSLRDISVACAVNLGLFYYHFGSKEALFEQVVARRATALAQIRQQRLSDVVKQGSPPLEAVMDAFMRPLFELKDAPDVSGESYVRVLTTIAHSDRWLTLFDRYFDETAHQFLSELHKILPNQTEEKVLHSFSVALNVMLTTVVPSKRFKSLVSNGNDSWTTAYEEALIFVCAGMRAL